MMMQALCVVLTSILAVGLAQDPPCVVSGHATPKAISGYTVAGAKDLRGHDLTKYRYCHTSIYNCAHRCNNKTACVAFTYVSSGLSGARCCYLKAVSGPLPLVPFRKGDVGVTYAKNESVSPSIVLPPGVMPPPSFQPPPPTLPTAEEAVAADPDLTQFYTVAYRLGFLDLSNTSDATFFAPTDEAFQVAYQLGDSLGMHVNYTGDIDPTIAAITSNLLSLHIVLGHAYTTAELTQGLTLETLAGNLNVLITGNSIQLVVAAMPSSTATLVGTEILAANNVVIHKIDTVLSNLPFGK